MRLEARGLRRLGPDRCCLRRPMLQRQRQKLALSIRVAHVGAKCLVLVIVDAQCVAVHDERLVATHVYDRVIVQKPDAGALTKGLTDQEVSEQGRSESL